MSEAAFWRVVWLVGIRAPWSFGLGVVATARVQLVGTATLVVARYTGWNLLERRWCRR